MDLALYKNFDVEGYIEKLGLSSLPKETLNSKYLRLTTIKNSVVVVPHDYIGKIDCQKCFVFMNPVPLMDDASQSVKKQLSGNSNLCINVDVEGAVVVNGNWNTILSDHISGAGNLNNLYGLVLEWNGNNNTFAGKKISVVGNYNNAFATDSNKIVGNFNKYWADISSLVVGNKNTKVNRRPNSELINITDAVERIHDQDDQDNYLDMDHEFKDGSGIFVFGPTSNCSMNYSATVYRK